MDPQPHKLDPVFVERYQGHSLTQTKSIIFIWLYAVEKFLFGPPTPNCQKKGVGVPKSKKFYKKLSQVDPIG